MSCYPLIRVDFRLILSSIVKRINILHINIGSGVFCIYLKILINLSVSCKINILFTDKFFIFNTYFVRKIQKHVLIEIC
jgi:hypothetical protein